MKAGKVNYVLGLALILISLFFVVPVTIKILANPMNGFNMSYMLLPFLLPLCISPILGAMVFLNFEKHIQKIKFFLIGVYGLFTSFSFLSCFFLNDFWFLGFFFLIPLVFSLELKLEKLKYFFLVNNGFMLIFQFGVLLILNPNFLFM